MQKKSLLLALALGFSAPLWAQDVNINGTGVSVEANKAPVHTAKNPQAIARLPANYHLAVPGKFTVAVAALNSPPLTVFLTTTRPCSAAKSISPAWSPTAWGWS
jgi:polar amino acid transport system substrate-binding protein